MTIQLSAAENAASNIRLTAREVRIIELVADGWTDARIGQEMGYTLDSAEEAVRRLRNKVSAVNRAHLVHLAHRLNWIT